MEHQTLRKVGLKITAPRIKILEILQQARDQHLSAEDIYHRLARENAPIGLATVYRVLTQFEQAGLISRHNFGNDHAVFELKEGEHHDHMVCVRCGHVEEFVDEVIEAHQKKIAEKSGFQMLDHRLDIYGICQRCLNKSK
jgi:Fur family ferric uptake transcriptional regulator